LRKDNNEDLKNTSPQNVIRLIDGFIEQMRQTRKTMALALSLSITSIVVAPVSIGLSISLLQHPSSLLFLKEKMNFTRSCCFSNWSYYTVFSMFGGGIKQYRSINSWNKKYSVYSKKKEELDRNIATEYDLDQD
jgi:hypothetical protein